MSVTQLDEPDRGPSQAILPRDRSRRKAGKDRHRTIGARGAAPRDRRHGRIGQAGDEADQGAHLARRDALGRQALSLFEPTTEIIRKGKAAKPNEFGKMVKLQEAENQIVTGYEVYERRPHDTDLLIAAIEFHQSMPAADAGFYSARNEAAAKALGVKHVCIPNRATKNLARKREQKKPWARNGAPGAKAALVSSSDDTD